MISALYGNKISHRLVGVCYISYISTIKNMEYNQVKKTY